MFLFGIVFFLAFLVIGFLYSAGLLEYFDVELFMLINSFHPHPMVDSFMILISEFGRGIFWSSIIVSLWFFGRRDGKQTALLLLIVFLISMFVGEVAKSVSQRPRPFLELVNVNTLLQTGADSSFPSGHALTVIAGAVISLFRIKRIFAIFLTFEAFLVAYSRIYVGVHYPSDILASVFLALSIALITLSQAQRFEPLFNKVIAFWYKFVKKIPTRFKSLDTHYDYKVVILGIAIFSTILLVDLALDVSAQGKLLLLPYVKELAVYVAKSIPNVIEDMGYLGVFILMLLEAASLPIPSEIILPFSGYLVSKNVLDFWLVILVSTIAAIIGSLIDYYLGFVFGVSFVPRFGKYILIKEKHVKIAEDWFNIHGSKAVFLCRLIPAIRTLISIVAGIAKMNILKFLIYTTIGCVIWNILLVYLGWYLGSYWYEIVSISEYLLISLIAIALFFAIFFYLKKKSKTGS